MLPIYTKIKNIFKHSKLSNILVNNKYTLYKKNHEGRGVTPRQNSTSNFIKGGQVELG